MPHDRLGWLQCFDLNLTSNCFGSKLILMPKLPPLPQSWAGSRASAMSDSKRAGGETEPPKRKKKLRIKAKEKPEDAAANAVDRLNSSRKLGATTEDETKKNLRRTDSDILRDLEKFEKQVVADILAEEKKEEDKPAEEAPKEEDKPAEEEPTEEGPTEEGPN